MKKGFTLIELLAVILILGIIALIAIPTVGNIIDEAKIGATKRSAENYIKGVETKSMLERMKGTSMIGRYEVPDLSVGVKGTTPSSGYVVIDNDTVVECSLIYDGYVATCDDGGIIVTKEGEPVLTSILWNDQNSNGIKDTGDKVCIGTECFYIISNNSGTIRALAEWNLNVGYNLSKEGSDKIDSYYLTGIYNSDYKAFLFDGVTYESLTNIGSQIKQNSTMIGYVDNGDVTITAKGVISFAPDNTGDDNGYWVDSDDNLLSSYGSSYSANVYDSNSNLKTYVDQYATNLSNMTGITVVGDLIYYNELVDLGCDTSSNTCTTSDYSWVYQTSYWTGSANAAIDLWNVSSSGRFVSNHFKFLQTFGVRPVIEIPNF